MKKSILLVAAAIGMLATSCNKDIINQQEDLTQTPITISATYEDGEKIAYTEDGANITAKWQSGDKLKVVFNNRVSTLDLSSGAGTTSATFTGTITGTPTATSMLICYVSDQNNTSDVTVNTDGSYTYTDGAFLSQDGTLASAASLNLYYGTTFYGTGSDISCTFSVNTSIMKFNVYAPAGVSVGTSGATLTYKSGDTELAKATFTVGTYGNNTVYLSIPSGHYSGEQTLVYRSGDKTKTETLSATQANFTAGQTYSKTIYFNQLATPLTFEAKVASSRIQFSAAYGMDLPLEYSTDDGVSWNTYSGPITLANIGDKVSFRGDNAAYAKSDGSAYSMLTCTNGGCYIYGNIMSLINSTEYASAFTLTSDNEWAFWELFVSSKIYNHPSKAIMLPATTLASNCYFMLFANCTTLTSAPDLPATTLAGACYASMFAGCTALTTAPELPATTLASSCYSNMFKDCTSLTSAPNLLATTLENWCYSNMFRGCTNLNSIKCLATDISAGNCTNEWLYGVAATGTFIKATSVAWSAGESGIPSGWTVQEQ